MQTPANIFLATMWCAGIVLECFGTDVLEKARAAASNAVVELIQKLGSENAREREEAQRALQQQGRSALAALREATGAKDPEVRMRALEILRAIRSRENPAAYVREASDLIARGEYEQGIEKLNGAIDIEPAKADLYLYRAAIWHRLKEYARAAADMTRAIELAPNNPALFAQRARLWSTAHEYDKALADFSAAIERAPDDVEMYCDRGRAWMEKHDYDKAMADFQKAMDLAPEAPGPHVLMAWAWAEQEEYQKAIEAVNKAIALDSTFALAYLTRADAYVMCGQYEKALEDYQRTEREWEDDLPGHANLGYALFMAKRHHEAREVYRRCLQPTARTPAVWNNIAWVQATCPYDELRDGASAVSNALRACEATRWLRADYTDTLAAAYAEKGDFTNAVKYQEMAIRLLPKPRKDFLLRLSLFRRGIPYREGQTNDIPPRVEEQGKIE